MANHFSSEHFTEKKNSYHCLTLDFICLASSFLHFSYFSRHYFSFFFTPPLSHTLFLLLSTSYLLLINSINLQAHFSFFIIGFPACVSFSPSLSFYLPLPTILLPFRLFFLPKLNIIINLLNLSKSGTWPYQ